MVLHLTLCRVRFTISILFIIVITLNYLLILEWYPLSLPSLQRLHIIHWGITSCKVFFLQKSVPDTIVQFLLTWLKVGVNHGIFHVYHFWNFLIFKCTWVCSSSSSKNKNIFLNLSINSINLKMSIYLNISKMCSSLFRGEIKLARV